MPPLPATDTGSIQGDTWHDYVGNAAANASALANDMWSYGNVILGI